MPRPVRDQLLDLEDDVRRIRLAPAEAVRRRGRARARRRVAVAAAGLAVVVGLGGTGLVRLTAEPRTEPAASAPSPSSVACPGLDLSLPDGPEEIAVRVYDGVDAAGGRDEAVAEELRNRRFAVVLTGGDTPEPIPADAVAVLRYGPGAVGKVALLQAMLLNKAETQFDRTRTGDEVDLVIGKGFQQFATPTEINQALVEAGQPTAPPVCLLD